MQYNFKWDPVKAFRNIKKHAVSFKLASEVFSDPMALSILDSENSSKYEERWITLGLTHDYRYLVVVHTWQDENSASVTIRLISARYATKHEKRQYAQG